MGTEKDMSDRKDHGIRLVDAVRRMKVEAADRDDVVIDMKEADRARLELLADELKPVFDDVPADDDRFDFALSSGMQPRLWIDATAHVMMGRDRRVYRFVRDTRLGRVVLAESSDMAVIEHAVVDYIAERVLERERVLAGETIDLRNRPVSAPALDQSQPKRDEETDIQSESNTSGPIQLRQDRHEDGVAEAELRTRSPAEPSAASAFAALMWIMLGLLIGGGSLMWLTGQLG